MVEILNIGRQVRSILPIPDKIDLPNHSNVRCLSSIEQCADAPDNQRSCCCFMQVVNCILAPFKAVIACIAWILCCSSTSQKEATAEFGENLKKNLDLLLESFKTTEKLEKGLKEIWDPKMLPYIGTPYEKMAKAEKEGNDDEFAHFDEELLKQYPFFKIEAEPFIVLLSFDHIFQDLSEKIVNLIAEERSKEILNEIAHGNLARLEHFKNLEKALMVLKENHSFRALVIERVFKDYLEKFNVGKDKFPLIASLYSVLNETLQNPHSADEWTQVLLDEVLKNKKVVSPGIPAPLPPHPPLPLIIEEGETPNIEIHNDDQKELSYSLSSPPMPSPLTSRKRGLSENYMTLPRQHPGI